MSSSQELEADHLGYVFASAKRYASKYNGDPGDHVGDAWMGLRDAAEKFDPSHGVKFLTYASRRVHGAILDASRNECGRYPGKRDFLFRTLSLHQPIAGDDTTMAELKRRMQIRDIVPAPEETSGQPDWDFWRVACLGLSKLERVLVLLYFVEGLTMDVIAQVHMHCSQSMCSLRLKGLRARMAGNLERHGFITFTGENND